jgi:uncharacterized protein YnzC (UPF0291/DUF896 family)
MSPEKMARISELTCLARERALTDAEQTERALLRREYIDDFKANTRQTLDNTLVQNPDGTKVPLRDAVKERVACPRPKAD